MLKKGRRVVPETQEEQWEAAARRQLAFAKSRRSTLDSYGDVMERSHSKVWRSLSERVDSGCSIISGYMPGITDLENEGRHLRLKDFFSKLGYLEIRGGFGKVTEAGEIEDVLERALIVFDVSIPSLVEAGRMFDQKKAVYITGEEVRSVDTSSGDTVLISKMEEDIDSFEVVKEAFRFFFLDFIYGDQLEGQFQFILEERYGQNVISMMTIGAEPLWVCIHKEWGEYGETG